jgi:two-component system, NtrC family, sensor histidine kinase KinB
MHMFGLRQKLSLGFGGLLVIIVLIGTQGIRELTELGPSIDVILRENYRSVIACQQMNEALERIDDGALFIMLGYEKIGNDYIVLNEPAFVKALQIELNNITLPHEGEKANLIRDLFAQYQATIAAIQRPGLSSAARRDLYFAKLLPLFRQIKNSAEKILHINQDNMSEANDRARAKAAAARQRMYALLCAGALLAMGFMYFIGKWVLRPITRLIDFTDQVARGNLELVMHSSSRDEIGRLSAAFNDMTASLRELRRADQAKLIRAQRSTQQTFNSLPDSVALVDLEGRIEVATETARETFGLKPGALMQDMPGSWMAELYSDALAGGRAVEGKGDHAVIQYFLKSEEHFFRPRAVPILDNEKQPIGIVLIFEDITQLRQQDDMKRGLISTVSHQLKTPLTSMRMAIHLLLEEKIGALNDKQAEMLIAARDDSDRLYHIIEDLLDISRIKSGRVPFEYQSIAPRTMVMPAVESFQSAFRDRGVTLKVEVPDTLPAVRADRTRIDHVVSNLLSNALKYTAPGGSVTVSAQARNEWVGFSVADTGKGIPSHYCNRIFEQFFRVPDDKSEPGAGLGLAIAREIVEAHGGTISVESGEGTGSTFTFTLKRADAVAVTGENP